MPNVLPDSPNLKPDQKPDVSHYRKFTEGKKMVYILRIQKMENIDTI